MDYKTLIDAETWAFIHRTAEYYPPDTTRMSIAEQRRIYDEMCREFFEGYPPNISVADTTIAGVRVRVYEKTDAHTKTDTNVVFFHGGGFVVGGLESHDDVCAEICDRTGFRVIYPDYRLSPEYKHPAAFEDALAVTQQVSATWPGVLILAGDSAGANLAAAVSHNVRGEIEISGQVLIYGAFGGDVNAGSYITHANAPMLTRDEIIFYMNIRYHGTPPTDDPTSAPLQDSDFSNLPPSVLISAECDPISDDSRVYRDKILAAGGQAIWVNEPGLVHGYLRARSGVKRARDSFTRIIKALKSLGSDAPFPPDL